jgi:Adenosine deaminase
MRVFINDKGVDVPRGARVRDAVAQADDGLARLLDSAAYVTDAAGRPIDSGEVIAEAGAVFRVVVSAKREGKPRLTKDALRRWPKAELHVHLDGALRPATMLELARAQGVRLPADTPEALAKTMLVRDAKNLEEYLEKYMITLSVLQTASALERVAYEFVLDKAAENVR